jgi:hypothetical protein
VGSIYISPLPLSTPHDDNTLTLTSFFPASPNYRNRAAADVIPETAPEDDDTPPGDGGDSTAGRVQLRESSRPIALESAPGFNP